MINCIIYPIGGINNGVYCLIDEACLLTPTTVCSPAHLSVALRPAVRPLVRLSSSTEWNIHSYRIAGLGKSLAIDQSRGNRVVVLAWDKQRDVYSFN